jgi:diguanylate cyclase (GGDEF)-like protein
MEKETKLLGSTNHNEEISRFLGKLNEDLQRFIQDTIVNSSNLFNLKWKEIGNRYPEMKCHDFKKCNASGCPAFRTNDFRCWLVAGTHCGGTVQGEFAKKYKNCFNCDYLKHIYSDPLKALYENITIIIRNLLDRDCRLIDLATRDNLTGLYNRHFFNEMIQIEEQKAKRANCSLSIIMIDIDNFKYINDTFGHLMGDHLLVVTANLIRDNVRPSDIVVRYGGDEFLIVAFGITREEALSIVHRLHKNVAKWNKKNNKKGLHLSLSIGCSIWKPGDDLLKVIEEADKEMYKDKAAKRDNEHFKL